MFKVIAMVQAVLLTALFVHNIHLEGLLHDKSPTVFYNQDETAPKIEIPLNKKPLPLVEPVSLLPEDDNRNGEIESLNDILGGQANNQDGPDPTLFGNMQETNKSLAKSKVKIRTKNLCKN